MTTANLAVVIGVGAAVLVAVALWVRSLVRKANAMTFEVTSDGLRVNAPLYGKVIPRSSMKLSEAKVVTLDRDCELRPRWRTNGIGMPSIRIGWFRLNNRSKALVYLVGTNTALCVPTTEGHVLLLGSRNTNPEHLLESLKSRH